MRIDHMPSIATRLVSKLTFETDAERALTDDELIRLCSNLVGISYDKDTGSYQLTGNSFGPECEYGGEVRRQYDDIAIVTVYVDDQ